jgi:hypothetical protein
MAWFLALQGVAHMSHQSSVYELQDSVDVDQIAQEMVSSATLDRVVPVPVVVPQNTRRQQKVTLYVRPAAWGLWTFYQLSEEDRRQLAQENPLLNALSQAAQQQAQAAQQQAQAAQAGRVNPLTGQVGPGSSGSLGTRR